MGGRGAVGRLEQNADNPVGDGPPGKPADAAPLGDRADRVVEKTRRSVCGHRGLGAKSNGQNPSCGI